MKHFIEKNGKKEINNTQQMYLSSEKMDEIIAWLKSQVEHLTTAINTEQQNRNYGREAQYEGMRDAFIRCLNKMTNQQYWN